MLLDVFTSLFEQGVALTDVVESCQPSCNDLSNGSDGTSQTIPHNAPPDMNVTGTINTLVEWAGKTTGVVVYDSDRDEFTDTAVFDTLKGKANIAVIGLTTDGDVFGGFYSVAVTARGSPCYDPNIFAFSLESNGRCATPQKFAVKERLRDKATVEFFENNTNGFISFWVDFAGGFWLGNERSNSTCIGMSCGFEEQEDTTLSGKDGNFHGEVHHCIRLIGIQLE